MARRHCLEVQLDDRELEELDEQRGGIPRAVFLRSLLRRPPQVADVASRVESLAILSGLARDGKVAAARVAAAIALARELRDDQGDATDPLERLLRAE